VTFEAPRFFVRRRQEATGILTGFVSTVRVSAETWVGDRHLGYLLVDGSLMAGRWRRAGEEWAFAPHDPRGEHTRMVGTTVVVLDSYWGHRANLVLDPAARWVKAEWSDPGDHDHCALCWAKVDADRPQHASNGKGDVVCPECHERYVLPGDLGFIRPQEPGGASDA
jgi:hypothetical protein